MKRLGFLDGKNEFLEKFGRERHGRKFLFDSD